MTSGGGKISKHAWRHSRRIPKQQKEATKTRLWNVKKQFFKAWRLFTDFIAATAHPKTIGVKSSLLSCRKIESKKNPIIKRNRTFDPENNFIESLTHDLQLIVTWKLFYWSYWNRLDLGIKNKVTWDSNNTT